jgi:hypothetical protein
MRFKKRLLEIEKGTEREKNTTWSVNTLRKKNANDERYTFVFSTIYQTHRFENSCLLNEPIKECLIHFSLLFFFSQISWIKNSNYLLNVTFFTYSFGYCYKSMYKIKLKKSSDHRNVFKKGL